MVARAAKLFHAALHVGIECPADGDVALRGEHRLGGFGRELAAGIGRAGLHDHRPALDRAGDIERAAHREIFALVIEHMHFRRIEEDAVLDVADESIVGPAIPQPGDHVVELARAAIAFAMLHMLVEAEIERRVGIGGGDDVPAGAAAAEDGRARQSAAQCDRARRTWSSRWRRARSVRSPATAPTTA